MPLTVHTVDSAYTNSRSLRAKALVFIPRRRRAIQGIRAFRTPQQGELKYGAEKSGVVMDSYECDVLVVGSGAAGLTTAIACREFGQDVLLVEKTEYFGGTTAFSAGV